MKGHRLVGAALLEVDIKIRGRATAKRKGGGISKISTSSKIPEQLPQSPFRFHFKTFKCMHVTDSLSCIMFNMIVINNNNYMETSDQSLWLFYKNSEIKAPAHIFMG